MRLGEILHRKAYHKASPDISPASRLSHHHCHQHVLHSVQKESSYGLLVKVKNWLLPKCDPQKEAELCGRIQ